MTPYCPCDEALCLRGPSLAAPARLSNLISYPSHSLLFFSFFFPFPSLLTCILSKFQVPYCLWAFIHAVPLCSIFHDLWPTSAYNTVGVRLDVAYSKKPSLTTTPQEWMRCPWQIVQKWHQHFLHLHMHPQCSS